MHAKVVEDMEVTVTYGNISSRFMAHKGDGHFYRGSHVPPADALFLNTAGNPEG
jgi:hypothetical protein